MKKIKIGFICVHNSCRSIMAEGIARKKYSDIFEVYSAGTEKNDTVNTQALNILANEYEIHDEFHSKLIDELPKLDIVITMGCNVECPFLPSKYREDFGIDDPSHQSDEIFKLTAKIIELKIDLLVNRIESGKVLI
ncbi:arsenate reductase ArsC [Culicoidibacter larvae]|uniref:Arsenate reductase ArsC n=2 Tax=Culicoidibacter larvae TaxID=2579976 RepID=A0A5R8QFP0_9FIRM|nr:arsenate reductase ArsC [Culicoidibacter larvae]